MKQENGWADWLDQKECLGCRIIYSIFSSFPPMPSARAYNVETGEYFPFDRLRSLPNGYEMAKAQGIAWTCNCRGRSQNLSDAQPFQYVEAAMGGDVQDIAARGVSEAQEAECFSQYERELVECSAFSAMTKNPDTYVACKQQAFLNYNQCRGY